MKNSSINIIELWFLKIIFFYFFFYRTARLFEIGLTSLWQNWYEPDSKPCFDDKKNGGGDKNKKNPPERLSLTNLTGAFAVLAIGCGASILTFLTELIVSRKKSNLIMINPI